MPCFRVYTAAEGRALDEALADPAADAAALVLSALVEQPPSSKARWLCTYAQLDLANCARCALASQASPDSCLRGTPVLCLAARQGAARTVGVLLGGGADPGARDTQGNTALMAAVRGGRAESVQALLDASDLAAVNAKGLNALHLSVVAGNLACFSLLLPRAADVDARTAACEAGGVHGKSALHLACERGAFAMVKLLRRCGADRCALDSEGESPLARAVRGGQLLCLNVLLGSGKNPAAVLGPEQVCAAGPSGATAMHVAAAVGDLKCAGMLLCAGARLEAVDGAGDTPLALARRAHPGDARLLALLAGEWAGPLPGASCEHCGAAASLEKALKTCSGCEAARFCSEDCSRACWPAHRPECQRRVKARAEAAAAEAAAVDAF